MKQRHQMEVAKRESLARRLRELLEARENVTFALLHGSFAHEALPFSDIDIAVYLTPSPADSITATLDLKEYLELGLGFGYDVDVQILNKAMLGFRLHASQGQVLVCRDWNALDDFREKTMLDYWDYEPVLRQNLEWMLSP